MLVEEALEITLPRGFVMVPGSLDEELLEGIVEINNASQEALTGKRPNTVSSQRNGWANPRFDPARSARIVVAPDGRYAGYIVIWDINPVPVNIWVHCRVHPDFEGLGIGTALHTWGEQRARKALDRVPDDVKVTMDTGVLSQHTAAKKLLTSLGMERVRYFFRMAIDLDSEISEPHLPEGVVIRPWSEVADRISLRDLIEADDEAFSDHWGHVDQPLEELVTNWEQWLKDDDVDPSIWFLALDGNQLAGISLCESKSQGRADWAYVDSLAVRRPWRRQGLGLALLHYTFRHFQAKGYTRVELHVDASNLTGATRLYERAGMHVAEQNEAYHKVLRDGRDITTQTLEASG